MFYGWKIKLPFARSAVIAAIVLLASTRLLAQEGDVVSISSCNQGQAFFSSGMNVEIKFTLHGTFEFISADPTNQPPQLLMDLNGNQSWAEYHSVSNYSVAAGTINRTDVRFLYTVKAGDMARPLKFVGDAFSWTDRLQFNWNGCKIALTSDNNTEADFRINTNDMIAGDIFDPDFSYQNICIYTMRFDENDSPQNVIALTTTNWCIECEAPMTSSNQWFYIWPYDPSIVMVGGSPGPLLVNMPLGSKKLSFNVRGMALGETDIYLQHAEDYSNNVSEGVSHAIRRHVNVSFTPFTAPYYAESFEAGFGRWVASSGNDFGWSRQSSPKNCSNGSPDAAADGAVYMFAMTYLNNYPSKTAAFEAVFDFSHSPSPELTFNYYMYGSTMGSLYVDVYNGSWNNAVWSLSGQQHASSDLPWGEAAVDLSAYAGAGEVTIRFRCVTGTGRYSDMAVDNICISDAAREHPFSVWTDDQSIPGGMRCETDIPVADGVVNLIKYACGLPAMTDCSSSNLLSVVAGESSTFSVQYYKSKTMENVELEPVWSSTLDGPWCTDWITTEYLNDEGGREKWKASVPKRQSGFLRLRATQK